MELKDVIAISGKPGLYEIKAQSNKGVIVQSLVDEKKMSVNITHNISSLNEILIYTYEDEMPLRMVFKSISEYEGEVMSHKEAPAKLLSFFREVAPNFDEERVYASNVKKILQWYHLLAAAKFDFTAIKEEEEENQEA